MLVNDELRAAFAPKGTLRIALNFGNRVLVGRDAGGAPTGISCDLGHALAAALRLPVQLIELDRAVDVSSSAADDLWDICFLAVDPARAETISFTRPYVRIEGNYLIAPGSAAETAPQVIANGLRVGSVTGSAYTLHLQRQSGAENLVPMADIHAALAALDAGHVDAIAGIRQPLQAEADLRPGARLAEPPFMAILQAMGTPTGRPAASAFLQRFLDRLALGGYIARILERHGVSGDCAIMPEPSRT